jgi:hypothetical protein
MERSPIFSLDREISSAPFAAAPEKAKKLKSLSHSITLLFDDQRADFCVAAISEKDGRFIKASAGALNLLWCASYAYWLLYRGFVKAQRLGHTEYSVSGARTVSEALSLYQWAIQSAVECKLEPWPVGAPMPVRSPEPNSPVHVANEVFLVAVGWILLHEIGHHELGHPREAIGPASKQEEHDADHFASDWLLSEVSDSALLLKRSLGIAVG